jgi:hypothetical protein
MLHWEFMFIADCGARLLEIRNPPRTKTKASPNRQVHSPKSEVRSPCHNIYNRQKRCDKRKCNRSDNEIVSGKNQYLLTVTNSASRSGRLRDYRSYWFICHAFWYLWKWCWAKLRVVESVFTYGLLFIFLWRSIFPLRHIWCNCWSYTFIPCK